MFTAMIPVVSRLGEVAISVLGRSAIEFKDASIPNMNVMQQSLIEILGRSESFIHSDILQNVDEIKQALRNSRLLVIGAGGSIGRAFVDEVTNHEIRSLHLVDVSENNLVEVVRNLRASGKSVPSEFRTYAIDFSLPEFSALLKGNKYDYVLNFAALKHVRSERDPFTLMRMIQVNVVANERLADRLSHSGAKLLFSVSSDKAVRPSNAMGATKALMERVLLSRSNEIPFQSARFANVAFSDGSLLCSFQQRLEKRQPLSAPYDVKRYFISAQEAGQLCLLGCFVGNNREIFYPRFQPESEMSFAEIAKIFLEANGLRPIECSSEDEARAVAKELKRGSTEWPCYFTASDTSGEKPIEEFYDENETRDDSRFNNVGVITNPIFQGREIVDRALSQIESLRSSGSWTRDALMRVVKAAVPELSHIETEKHLDEKM